MSDALEGVVGLCADITRIAVQCKSGADWHLQVEPLCDSLETYMEHPAPELVWAVLADPRIKALMPDLHRFRAAFEFEREAARARDILGSPQPATRLRHYVEKESHWSLPPAIEIALQDCDAVLIAGAGPLPLTALAVASHFGVQVTLVERDAAAFALAMRLIAIADLDGLVTGLHGDIATVTELAEYGAVFATALLGVGDDDDPASSKNGLLSRLLVRLRPGVPLILREPHGLGALLYPPAALTEVAGLSVSRILPESAPGQPYRSGMLVARRLEPAGAHADTSTLSVHP